MASPSSAAVPRGVAFLQAARVPFETHEYAYVEKGGSGASSSALGVCEHAVIKTLLFQESEDLTPFIVLQHGDAVVDTKKLIKELARTRGRSSGVDGQGIDSAVAIAAGKKARCFMTTHETAEKHTGFQVGGTSPFGLLDTSLRIFIEASLLRLLPEPAPTTVAPSKPEDALLRDTEVAAWDSLIGAVDSFVDFNQLDTRLAKPATLDLVTPAWCMINGGARGTLVALSVRDIVKLVRPVVISVATEKKKKAPDASSSPPAPAASSSPPAVAAAEA